jgi:anti-sigma B factor antagonist
MKTQPARIATKRDCIRNLFPFSLGLPYLALVSKPDPASSSFRTRNVIATTSPFAYNARVIPPPFRVETTPGSRDGLSILSVRGSITTKSAEAFHEAFNASTAPQVIIDLTEVPSVDSMAIGTLVRAFVACHKSGRKLALVGLNHRIRNVLNITGVEPLFDMYPTVKEAEAGLA